MISSCSCELFAWGKLQDLKNISSGGCAKEKVEIPQEESKISNMSAVNAVSLFAFNLN